MSDQYTKPRTAQVLEKFVQNHGSPWRGRVIAVKSTMAARQKAYNISFFLLSHPAPLRAMRMVFRFTRFFNPVWNVGNFCVLTAHKDVKEVLVRLEDFSSADTMNQKTPAGPFVLSLDWRTRHDRELEILKQASFPFVDEDAKRISILAATRASGCVNIAIANAKAGKAQINVAADLTEDVALHVVEQYIGVITLNDNERNQLREWLRILAAQIFTPPPTGSALQAQTATATTGLICHIHKVIANLANTGNPLAKDTLLQRLVKIVAKEKRRKNVRYPWLNDDWICALVSGMIVAGNATVARAETQAIYRLMTLRGAHGLAVKAARDHLSKNDDASRNAMLQIVFEALRFNPMLPVLSPRLCVRDTTIAAFGFETDEFTAAPIKTPHRETRVKAGVSVLPFVFAAMFDKAKFEKPDQFSNKRKLEDYLHFGWGPHMCFGKFVAEIQFVETAAALFGREEFTVQTLGSRKIKYQGPAVIDYPLELVIKNAEAKS